MSADPSQLLQEFEELVNLAKRAHDLACRNIPSKTDEGHFINENTLIRIDEALETIRRRLSTSAPDWEKEKTTLPGFDAYITMRVYRNAIVHNRGKMTEAFQVGKRKVFNCYYEQFCQSVCVNPLQPGDKLMLSVRRPDFLKKLIEGVREFARNVVK